MSKKHAQPRNPIPCRHCGKCCWTRLREGTIDLTCTACRRRTRVLAYFETGDLRVRTEALKR